MRVRASTLEAFITDVANGRYDDDNGGRQPQVRNEIRNSLARMAKELRLLESRLEDRAQYVLTEEDADAWIALATHIMMIVGDVPVVRRLQSGWKKNEVDV